MDELVLYIREALDRKQGNVRRQRRRDALRLQLVRIFQLIADRGTFGMRWSKCISTFTLKVFLVWYYLICGLYSCLNGESNPLHPVVTEFLDGMRQCLELDTDRDSVAGREIRSCFALFVTNLIDCFPRKSICFFLILSTLGSLSQWHGVNWFYSRFATKFAEAGSAPATFYLICWLEWQVWPPVRFQLV